MMRFKNPVSYFIQNKAVFKSTLIWRIWHQQSVSSGKYVSQMSHQLAHFASVLMRLSLSALSILLDEFIYYSEAPELAAASFDFILESHKKLLSGCDPTHAVHYQRLNSVFQRWLHRLSDQLCNHFLSSQCRSAPSSSEPSMLINRWSLEVLTTTSAFYSDEKPAFFIPSWVAINGYCKNAYCHWIIVDEKK